MKTYKDEKGNFTHDSKITEKIFINFGVDVMPLEVTTSFLRLNFLNR